jgi:hypothetical protein
MRIALLAAAAALVSFSFAHAVEPFNPQPDPPGRHKTADFNPQPDPPGRHKSAAFNPQPDPPGHHQTERQRTCHDDHGKTMACAHKPG